MTLIAVLFILCYHGGMTDRRSFALRAAAEALEGHSWYLQSMLDDYNDPVNPVTVEEIVELIRREARRV